MQEENYFNLCFGVCAPSCVWGVHRLLCISWVVLWQKEGKWKKKKWNEKQRDRSMQRRIETASKETNTSAGLCSSALNEYTQTQVKIKYHMQLLLLFSPFNLSSSLLTCWQHPPIPRQLESKCVFWRDSLSQHHSLPSKVSFKLDLYVFAMSCPYLLFEAILWLSASPSPRPMMAILLHFYACDTLLFVCDSVNHRNLKYYCAVRGRWKIAAEAKSYEAI